MVQYCARAHPLLLATFSNTLYEDVTVLVLVSRSLFFGAVCAFAFVVIRVFER